ncbi:MAG: hypothetical protein WDN06_18515 [Asticcacaulis sp.]
MKPIEAIENIKPRDVPPLCSAQTETRFRVELGQSLGRKGFEQLVQADALRLGKRFKALMLIVGQADG